MMGMLVDAAVFNPVPAKTLISSWDVSLASQSREAAQLCVRPNGRRQTIGRSLRRFISRNERHAFIWRASSGEEDKDNDFDSNQEDSTPSPGGDSDNTSNKDLQGSSIFPKGSILPGVKPPRQQEKIPKSILDIIRDQVFSFDTFFPTGQEPYEGGVLFTGNLRGDSAKSYTKLANRLKDKFGDNYYLFLLLNPMDNKPVAAVIPSEALRSESAPVPEWLAAASFGLLTVLTLLLRNFPALQLNLLANNPAIILSGVPGALVTAAILLTHEAGHYYAARRLEAEISLPYFIPSWQLGSFGGITRIKNVLRKRQDLIQFSAAGPLCGALLGLTLVLVGLILPPGENQGISINASAFHDSLLVGGLAKAILADALKEGSTVTINPLVLSAWSGLLVNAINSIPAGDLDGGRIAQGLWGRKVWSRLNGVSIGLLGLAGIFNDVALYWVVLIIFLQRGPILPQMDEVTNPDDKHIAAGLGVLILCLLVCFPFPLPFS
ncbi:hypothetical protein O6H91_09G075000 [Diphasiastrum complanatum]|uniref:Uncharacterized protein n=2 Tax=Diphasiastrum complanatum TaxID=34168 RepID=A0ACC2CR09_DIPCM|nr:hypothetical protein O6H91_09G075000 [Diphasiastrum complanatum]KAJ7544356.1 hypothetical protein O6H91_09G075000 [Diphasiastrum complanatum]